MSLHIYTISDLHFEIIIGNQYGFQEKQHDILNLVYLPLLTPDTISPNNILLLAGDICKARQLHYVLPLFEHLITQGYYRDIYYIAGNHEFWRSSWQSTSIKIRDAIKHNSILNQHFHFLDNDVVLLDNNTQLIGSTLWFNTTNIYQNEWRREDERKITKDFVKIAYEYPHSNKSSVLYRTLQLFDVQKRHERDVQFILNALETGAQQGLFSIVLTHHAPSIRYLAHKKDKNGKALYGLEEQSAHGYGSNLPTSLTKYKDHILSWIHGHTHFPKVIEYQHEYGFNVICNTAGYWEDEFFGTAGYQEDEYCGSRKVIKLNI